MESKFYKTWSWFVELSKTLQSLFLVRKYRFRETLYSQRVLSIIGSVGLLVLGSGLLVAGLYELSYSQEDPQQLDKKDPEQNGGLEDPEGNGGIEDPQANGGVVDPQGSFKDAPQGSFIAPFPQQLLTFNPQGSFLNNPEGSILIDTAEQLDPLDPEQTEELEPEPLEANYDDSLPRFATGNLLRFIEGSFGALVMVSAGLGAIVAAAFGAYKAAIGLLFVAVGAFILRALVSLFFGTDYPAYDEPLVGDL